MCNKNFTISIVTVCFNSIKTIERAILSVLGQTYSLIEYIIIDGGSIDGTVDVIKQYEDRIAYWVSEPDSGIYDAMNKGIKAASGDYIYFLGSDDWLCEQDIIKRVSQHLAKNQQIDILCGRVIVVDEKNRIKIEVGRLNNDEEVKDDDFAPHQGQFTRLALLKNLPFNKKYKVAADFDFFMAMNLQKRKISFIDDCIAYYSSGGASSNYSAMKEEYIKIYKSFIQDTHKIAQFENRYRKAWISSTLWEKYRAIIWTILDNLLLSRTIRKIQGWRDYERYYWFHK